MIVFCFNLAHTTLVEDILTKSLIRQQLPGLKDLDCLNSYTEDKTHMDHKGDQYEGFRYFLVIPENDGAS